MKAAISLLKKTYSNWSDHNAPRLGASVAFYTLLSFAPLLVLTVAVIALVFDQQRAQNGLIDQARQMIGDRGADTVKSLLETAKAGVGSAYGAAGSLVAVIVWVYYSAQIFFFGAEFTRVRADARAGARAKARTGQAVLSGSVRQKQVSDSTAAAQPDFAMNTSATPSVAHGVGQESRASLLLAAAIGFLLARARAAKQGESQRRTPRPPRP